MSLIRASGGDTHEFLIQYRRRSDAYAIAGLVVFKAQGKTWEEYLGTRQPLALMNEQELHRLYSIDDLSTIAHEAGHRHPLEQNKGSPMTAHEGDNTPL